MITSAQPGSGDAFPAVFLPGSADGNGNGDRCNLHGRASVCSVDARVHSPLLPALSSSKGCQSGLLGASRRPMLVVTVIQSSHGAPACSLRGGVLAAAWLVWRTVYAAVIRHHCARTTETGSGRRRRRCCMSTWRRAWASRMQQHVFIPQSLVALFCVHTQIDAPLFWPLAFPRDTRTSPADIQLQAHLVLHPDPRPTPPVPLGRAQEGRGPVRAPRGWLLPWYADNIATPDKMSTDTFCSHVSAPVCVFAFSLHHANPSSNGQVMRSSTGGSSILTFHIPSPPRPPASGSRPAMCPCVGAPPPPP